MSPRLDRPVARCGVRLAPDERAGRDHRPDGGLLAAVLGHDRVEPGGDLELRAAGSDLVADLEEGRVDDLGRATHALELERRLDEPDAIDDPVGGDDPGALARAAARPSRWIRGDEGERECHSIPTLPCVQPRSANASATVSRAVS